MQGRHKCWQRVLQVWDTPCRQQCQRRCSKYVLRRSYAFCGSTGNCDGSTGSTGPLYRFLLQLNQFPCIALSYVHDHNLQSCYYLFVVNSARCAE